MKIFIISGGSLCPSFIRDYMAADRPDAIVAADRGLVFCHEQQIRPDAIVGDFDSTDPAVVGQYRRDGGIPIDTYRPEKDLTDTDIAIRKAVEMGADRVVLFGATGTRCDHTLSNIFNLYSCAAAGIRASIVDPHNRITMLTGGEYRIRREEQFGNRISLFPFRGDVTGLTLRGLKYLVTDALVEQGDGGHYVSNEITGDEAVILWRSGILLLMETRD